MLVPASWRHFSAANRHTRLHAPPACLFVFDWIVLVIFLVWFDVSSFGGGGQAVSRETKAREEARQPRELC